MKKQLFIYLVLILCVLSTTYAEEVTVQIHPKSVGINESFTAVFSTPHNIQAQPDFSPLLADFEILSSSHGFSTSIINGAAKSETSWNLVLIPKQEGQLTIPALSFGQYASLPQTIEVTSSHAPKQDDDLFVETEIQPAGPVYEQTQLTYIIRLYYALQLAQASLTDLKANDPDAIIERLGNDVEYTHYHPNGQQYRVVERKYTVYPQHVGELIFDPIAFDGQVVIGRGSFFNVQTQHKRVYSNQEKVEIKPIPAPFQKSNWFPANAVTLSEEWSVNPEKAVISEPITWTLKITADGCPGNRIPDLSLHLPNDIKHYLDKPEVHTEGTIGTKQIKIALIPTKPGVIQIPEIGVKWWNLKTDQIQEAQLPSRTIQVQGAEVAMETTPLPVAVVPEMVPQSLPLWVWILIALNVIVVLGLFLFLLRRGKKPVIKPDSLSQIKSQLKQACQNHDPKQAESCLLAWASIIYPQLKPLNLKKMRDHVSLDLQAAIDGLNQALYGRVADWKGETLWKAFSEFKPSNQKPARKPPQTLRTLYPTEL